MNTQPQRLLVTVLMPDRVGILRDVTGALFDAGANLTDVRQAVVGGVFVLNAIAEFPAGSGAPSAVAVVENVRAMLPDAPDAQVSARPCGRHDIPAPAGSRYVVSVVGPDAPGRIHRIAEVVASHGANVEDWRHDLSDPARTLTIGVVTVPPSCDPSALRASLEAAMKPLGLLSSLTHENFFRATNEVGPIRTLLDPSAREVSRNA